MWQVINEDSKVATEVFYWTVGKEEDSTQKGDIQVREDELDESPCICGVQDGQRRENSQIKLHSEMEKEVSGRNISVSKSKSVRGSTERDPEIVQSRNGGVANRTPTGCNGAAVGIRASKLVPHVWKNVSYNGF